MFNFTDEVKVTREADGKLTIESLDNLTFHSGYAIWLKDVEIETGTVYGFLVPGKVLVNGTQDREPIFYSFGATQPHGLSGKYAEITVDTIALYPYNYQIGRG